MAFIASLGHNHGTTSTLVITVATAATVGDHVVVAAAANGKTLSSVKDSVGNTYTVDYKEKDGTHSAVATAHSTLTTALAVNDTITLTFSAASANWGWAGAYSGTHFTPIGSGVKTGTTASLTASVTPSRIGTCTYISVWAYWTNQVPTTTSSFTVRQGTGISSTLSGAVADGGGTGTKSVTWTRSAGGAYATTALVAAYALTPPPLLTTAVAAVGELVPAAVSTTLVLGSTQVPAALGEAVPGLAAAGLPMPVTLVSAVGTGLAEVARSGELGYSANGVIGNGIAAWALIGYPSTPRTSTTPGYGFLARNRNAVAVPLIRPPLLPPPSGRPTAPTTSTFTPPPAFLPSVGLVSIPQVSESYPQPVLSNGLPYATKDKKPWLPDSVIHRIWAKQLQIVIDGQDVTYFRGVPNIVKKWTSQEPFGDASATIVLSAVTSFDAIRQPVPFASGTYVGMAGTYTGKGYWLVASTGEVTPFGDASFFGDPLALLAKPASGIASHPTTYGYVVCAQDGGVFCYGACPYYTSLPGKGITPVRPIVGIALTKTAGGYWLLGADGGVFAFGDAAYYGNPITTIKAHGGNATSIARSVAGTGYIILTTKGHVYHFGDAVTHGTVTAHYVAPWVGISTHPSVTGYLIVNDLGYAFAMGTVHYKGGAQNTTLAQPMVGCYLVDATGYWQVAGDGGVFSYGNVAFYGSIPGGGLPSGGSLSWLYMGATVEINRIASTGAVTTLWEGVIGDWEDSYAVGAVGLTLQCTGCLFQMDWYISKPITNAPFVGYSPYTGHPIFGWDIGQAIATAINKTIFSPSVGTALGSQPLRFPGAGHPVTTMKGRINTCTPPTPPTGIITVTLPQWGKLMSTYIQQLLAQGAVQGGQQWTVHLLHPRTPIIVRKNQSAVTWVVSTGGRGVMLQLSQTVTSAATAIYGQGTAPPVVTVLGTIPGEQPSYRGVISEWANLQYPRTWVGAAPAWPLGATTMFTPGDGKTGLTPLTTWLRQCGWPFSSRNTFLPTTPSHSVIDTLLVQRLQGQFGQEQTGFITQKFWDTAFLNGINSETISSVWYAPLWETRRVEPYTYTPSGAILGANPFFTKHTPRVERFEQMGQMVGKSQGLLSAYLEGERLNAPMWVGTITLTADPEAGITTPPKSRFDIVAGQNILLRYFHGRDVLFHISNVTVTFTKLSVKLTVSSIATDLMTLAAIYARDSQALGIARQARPNMNNLNISSSTITFDSESGAGVIPPTRLYTQQWVVIRVPATESGQIAEVTLTCITPASGTPAQWSMGVFSGPITPSQLAACFGLLGPMQPAQITVGGTLIAGANPWNGYALKGNDGGRGLNSYGLLYAAGGPGSGNACGFFPSTPSGQPILTGRYLDGSSWTYNSAPGYSPWLWVAFYLTILSFGAGLIQPYGVGPAFYGTASSTGVISGHLMAAPHAP